MVYIMSNGIVTMNYELESMRKEHLWLIYCMIPVFAWRN